MTRKTVLIAGAGVAGPTLAYWLLKRGFEPVIVERSANFRAGGYIIDFWGVGFDVAERMGLVPALRDRGYAIDRVVFVRADGRERSSFKGGALRSALGDRFVSIPRGDLAQTIFDLTAGNIETLFGDEILRLEERDDGVAVTFRRGGTRTFDYVVGADGLHSGVRAATFRRRGARERYLGFYAAVFTAEGYSRRDEQTYLSFAAPGRQISRYALRHGQTGFLFVFRKDEPLAKTEHDLSAQIRILRRTFANDGWREWPEIERHLESCTDLYFDAVSQIELATWSKGRVALLGDAAYCPSLLAGEGTAFAMAGAYVLAGELAQAEGDYIAAFRRYERRFRPFILRKQKSARAFAGSFTPATKLGLFVRDQVLGLSGIPLVARWLVNRFVADGFTLPDYSR